MPTVICLSASLADFGSRSILTHVIVAFGFAGAVIAGPFV